MGKDIYIIVGNRGTGKSSLTRALTGISINQIKELTFTPDIVYSTFVHPRSLQEIKINTALAINILNQKNTLKNIITLRFESHNECESALDYINSFRSEKWVIKKVVFLGTYDLSNYPPNLQTLTINNPTVNTTNVIAKKVRSFFELI